jgi:hypothetical protein
MLHGAKSCHALPDSHQQQSAAAGAAAATPSDTKKLDSTFLSNDAVGCYRTHTCHADQALLLLTLWLNTHIDIQWLLSATNEQPS